MTYTYLTTPAGISAITYFSALPVKKGRRQEGVGPILDGMDGSVVRGIDESENSIRGKGHVTL